MLSLLPVRALRPLSPLFLVCAFAGTIRAQQPQSLPAATPATQSTPAVPAATPTSTVETPSVAPATPGSPGDASVAPATPALTAPAAMAPAPPSQNPDLPSVAPATPAPAAPVSVAPAGSMQSSAVESLLPFDPDAANTDYHADSLGSTYIPVDSWVYPAALRLYSMGFLDSAFLGLRPWTRRSLLHMLDKTASDVMNYGSDEAIEILASLRSYLAAEGPGADVTNASVAGRGTVYGFETGYTRLMGIQGNTLKNSYYLGQTLFNDYGRPYAKGFNNITGFSSVNEWGRFSFYVRGEYQHAPAFTGYSYAIANQLTQDDLASSTSPNMSPTFYQDTIPYGNTGAQNPFRIQEAVVSFHVLGHEISGGKSDAWLGPAQGGAFAWSNNAENIYSFRINRVEPLKIPLLHYITGPLRYDFFYGSLKGHNVPNNPWVHSEQFAFRPTSNLEFGFQRTVIFGGHNYPRTVPVTLHTFLKSFFNFDDVPANEKYSRSDPGARFTAFNFSWRLPFLSHWVTLYTDSEAHDDVSTISAPRRAAYRPGVYLSHVPGLPKMDVRVEAASTDYSTLRSLGGYGNYYETVQRQGYTNKGFIFGDWIGREAKGGQAWLTWHLSGNEWIQLEYMHKKTAKDFIAGGVTQNQLKLEVVKRLSRNLELDGWYQFERWKAPVYLTASGNASAPIGGPLFHPDAQTNNIVTVQFTWYPKLHTSTALNGK